MLEMYKYIYKLPSAQKDFSHVWDFPSPLPFPLSIIVVIVIIIIITIIISYYFMFAK